jgi:FkbM family methyltransferase
MSEFIAKHFTLRHRLVAAISRTFDGISYTARRGLVRGMRRQGGLGFIPGPVAPRNREEEFFRLARFDDLVVFDIGGFEGLMTLFFARVARTVVTYEPNPRNHQRLQVNVELNRLQNVIVRNCAVGETAGLLRLTYDRRMPGAGSADSRIVEQMGGDGPGATTVEVPVVSIDEDTRGAALPNPDFVKIDVEGFELKVLKGMQEVLQRSQPLVYMEMHGADEGDKIAKTSAIIAFMNDAGYDHIFHVETGASILSRSISDVSRGHLFCVPPRLWPLQGPLAQFFGEREQR